MKKLPKIISQEEFEGVFQATLRLKRSDKKRLALAMLLGFEAGMRISEILGWSNIIPKLEKSNVSDISIRIFGKGKKERIVPRPKRFNENAKEMLPLKISRRATQTFITKIGRDVLKRNITFHTLRHGFGSHLAGQGRPLHEIQMLMGHSRLDITGIYTHSNPKTAVEGARDVF